MQRGPQVSGYGNQINQITGKIPLYKPNDKGDMLIRILPAFANGQELPWVDFGLGSSDNNSGLGDQHFSVSAVCIFRDRAMSWLSAKSKDDDGEVTDSPATFVSKRVTAMIKKALQLKKAGYPNINDCFMPNQFDGSWISIVQLNLVQVLLFKFGGVNVRDRDGNPFRYGVVDLSVSGFNNLTKYLFSPRMADSSGNVHATCIEDSKFGDYCSCDNGSFVIVRRDPTKASKIEYDIMLSTPPQGWESGALDRAWAASQFRPWQSDAENAVYTIPSHAQVFDALEQLIPMDVLGFGLIDTPFETMLTPNMVELGRNLQLTRTEADVQDADQPQSPHPMQSQAQARPTPTPAQARPQPQGQAQQRPAPFKPMQQQQHSPAAAVRAPGPAAIAQTATAIGRGPTPPLPPSRPGAKPAFAGPLRQQVQVVPPEMEQLPHLGETETFMDPAILTPDGETIPTVEL